MLASIESPLLVIFSARSGRPTHAAPPAIGLILPVAASIACPGQRQDLVLPEMPRFGSGGRASFEPVGFQPLGSHARNKQKSILVNELFKCAKLPWCISKYATKLEKIPNDVPCMPGEFAYSPARHQRYPPENDRTQFFISRLRSK
jgi:hypothetical protein